MLKITGATERVARTAGQISLRQSRRVFGKKYPRRFRVGEEYFEVGERVGEQRRRLYAWRTIG